MRMEERAAGRGRGIRQQANIRDEDAQQARPRESARSRIGPLPYKATTRAERATSWVQGKIGTS